MDATRVIATRDALENGCRTRWDSHMKLTDVIRRPLVTEKTSTLREQDGQSLVFQVADGGDQGRDQAGDREAARRQGRERADRHRCTAR